MSNKPRVSFVLPEWSFQRMFALDDLAELKKLADVTISHSHADRNRALADAVAVITGWGSPQFDSTLLAQAPQLKLLAHSAGTVKPHVSEELYTRGIHVTTAAAANAVPVAQYTVALMVSMLKQTPWLHDAMRRNDLDELERRNRALRELMDIDIGIVGASRVGREVLRLLRSYPGLQIRLYDPFVTTAQAAEMGTTLSSLEDVCRCEVVSVHAPNIPETRHIFNAGTLALLPDHAVFINTARGALVDEDALIAEVRRRPLYVCLDVTDPEPPAADSPLRSEANILLTPHVAGALKQGCREMGRLAISQVIAFLKGEKLTHEITFEMLQMQA